MRRVVLLVCCGLASSMLVSGCSSRPSLEEIEQQNMAVVRGAHAALARGDFDSFKAAIGPNYVRHCQAMPPGLRELQGTEEFCLPPGVPNSGARVRRHALPGSNPMNGPYGDTERKLGRLFS
jgi:hypothetical protein